MDTGQRDNDIQETLRDFLTGFYYGLITGLFLLIVGKQSRTVRSDADAADQVFHNDDLQSFDSRYCKLLHFVLKS